MKLSCLFLNRSVSIVQTGLMILLKSSNTAFNQYNKCGRAKLRSRSLVAPRTQPMGQTQRESTLGGWCDKWEYLGRGTYAKQGEGIWLWTGKRGWIHARHWGGLAGMSNRVVSHATEREDQRLSNQLFQHREASRNPYWIDDVLSVTFRWGAIRALPTLSPFSR